MRDSQGMEIVMAWVVKPREATPHPSETPQHRDHIRMVQLLIRPFLSNRRLILYNHFVFLDDPMPTKREVQVEIDQTRSKPWLKFMDERANGCHDEDFGKAIIETHRVVSHMSCCICIGKSCLNRLRRRTITTKEFTKVQATLLILWPIFRGKLKTIKGQLLN